MRWLARFLLVALVAVGVVAGLAGYCWWFYCGLLLDEDHHLTRNRSVRGWMYE